MKVTISDVAIAAGVSISTVSKVINGSSRISETTKAKVKSLMKEMNYYPNSIARSFARQSSGNICILKGLGEGWDAVSNPYLYEIINGIEYVAKEADYLLSIINVNTETNIWSQLEKYIMEKRIDGFLIFASLIDKESADHLHSQNFPFMIIGEIEEQNTLSWIDLNNEIAGQQAIQHLLDDGRKNIIYVKDKGGDVIGEKRLKGIRDYLQSNSDPGQKMNVLSVQSSIEEGYNICRKIINERLIFDSIICSSSFTASGMVRALREMNINVPEEVSLVSFDKYPLSQSTIPTLTVVDMNLHELGVQSGKALLEKLNNPQLIIQHLIISSNLIPGGTTSQLMKSANHQVGAM